MRGGGGRKKNQTQPLHKRSSDLHTLQNRGPGQNNVETVHRRRNIKATKQGPSCLPGAPQKRLVSALRPMGASSMTIGLCPRLISRGLLTPVSVPVLRGATLPFRLCPAGRSSKSGIWGGRGGALADSSSGWSATSPFLIRTSAPLLLHPIGPVCPAPSSCPFRSSLFPRRGCLFSKRTRAAYDLLDGGLLVTFVKLLDEGPAWWTTLPHRPTHRLGAGDAA